MTHLQAALLVMTGGLFMSFAGLVLRLIEEATPIQILVYRSFALALAVVVIACLKRRQSLRAFLASLNGEDVIMGLFMAGAFSFYVYSILNTTVASTLFLLAAGPFAAALIGWVWINERPRLVTLITMVVAIVGVGIMVWDGFASDRWFGNAMALVSVLCFSIALVYVRRCKRPDMLGGTFLGGAFASLGNAVLALILGQGLVLTAPDLAISLASGLLTIGIGMAFVIWGASHLPAAEVAILALTESVAGPLWVYFVLGETASLPVLVGGAIVMASVIGQAWFARSPQHRAVRDTVGYREAKR